MVHSWVWKFMEKEFYLYILNTSDIYNCIYIDVYKGKLIWKTLMKVIKRSANAVKFCRYLMGGRTFSCLDAVINRYKTEQILEGHTLGSPVCKVRNLLLVSSCSSSPLPLFISVPLTLSFTATNLVSLLTLTLLRTFTYLVTFTQTCIKVTETHSWSSLLKK